MRFKGTACVFGGNVNTDDIIEELYFKRFRKEKPESTTKSS